MRHKPIGAYREFLLSLQHRDLVRLFLALPPGALPRAVADDGEDAWPALRAFVARGCPLPCSIHLSADRAGWREGFSLPSYPKH